MTLSEVKKELYKQKPDAHLRYIREGKAYYYADLWYDRERSFRQYSVEFEIPISDMGTADFEAKMYAPYLIRWMIWNETNETD